MQKCLVGYTGFVGSNLCEQCKFDGLYASKNIASAYGSNPELLVYAGIPAQKFIANKEPDVDLEVIKNAINNIKKINPKKLVLISTIDIYKNPIDVDENSSVEVSEEAYGKNRRYLEEWVQNNINDYLIVRLPGLFGKNIKKNFIYDLINIIPSMLNEEKYNELSNRNNIIEKYYIKQENGIYKCREITEAEKTMLKDVFLKLNFTALNFTDSRGSFQFYNLANLWKDINIALENKLKVINLATEPIKISELYKYIFKKEFVNEISDNIPKYKFKTKYDYLFNGKNGYIMDKNCILEDIKNFVTKKDKFKN